MTGRGISKKDVFWFLDGESVNIRRFFYILSSTVVINWLIVF